MFDIFPRRKSLKEIKQELDDAFGDMRDYNWYYTESKPEYVVVSGDNYPRTDIQVYDDNGTKCALVEMSVPGLTKDFVEVSLNDGILSVKGQKIGVDAAQGGKNGKAFKLKELHRSSFYREFNLNLLFEVDNDSAQVTLANGLLSVIIKAKGEVKQAKRKLEIN